MAYTTLNKMVTVFTNNKVIRLGLGLALSSANW